MTKSKPLYINLHIPKTAGYTLRYHLTKNLQQAEHLLLDYEFLGLDLFDPPLKYETYKNAAIKLIKSLSKEKRDNIKVIHGHTVPYGIHELFDREARYFTFVREPGARTVSVYHHLSYLNQKEGQEGRKKGYYNKYLRHNGKDLGFNGWLKKKYINDVRFQHFSMSGYLKEFGYLTGDFTNKNIKDALNKFYFIGTTENFGKESLYFFNELGMHKYFIDQNISVMSSAKKAYGNNLKAIQKINPNDNYLYQEALRLNKVFKGNNPEFETVILRKLREKRFMLPFTQSLFAPRQTIIRMYKSLFSGEPISAS